MQKQSQSFYTTSKLCNILFAYELDRRLKVKGLPFKTLVNAINPGLMLTTNLGRTYKPGENFRRKLLDFVFKIIGISDNPESSAKSVVHLINSAITSGQYYDKNEPIQSSLDSYDEQKAILLWDGSEELIGSKFFSK